MPRAFLITRRRYNGTGEFEETGREYSPERGVRLAEYGGGQQPTSDGASECGSESSSECPEELYNLTKLAEVSVAAAAGTLYPLRPQQLQLERTRLFFERIESERESLVELKSTRGADGNAGALLLEAARLPSNARYAEFKSENGILTETKTMTTTSSLTSLNGKHSPTILQQQQQIDRIDHQDGTEEHECPDCGKKYSTSSNLARHRQTHRSLGDKKARRCPHCDKVYVSIPAFSMHVRTHNQGCKCHYCGKCFSRPWLLQGHIRTHTGEKPFKCTICNKAFADKSNLRAHIQTHSNTKPHVCARCGKAFALKSYLYKHEESSCMRAHHHNHHHHQQQQQQQQQQRVNEKRESSTSPVSTSSQPANSRLTTSANVNVTLSQPTASPTSVIVPPRNFHTLETIREQQARPNSAFSAIIRHTRTTPETIDSEFISKRFKSDEPSENDIQPSKDLLSRMVIRTSVISPNPEHLARFGEKKLSQQRQLSQPQQTHQPFDFNDPTRVSAFSRPQSMTLNLALA